MKQDLVHITMHDRREVAFSLYLQTIMRGGGVYVGRTEPQPIMCYE